MPELPDINLYVQRLSERLVGEPLTVFRISSVFVLRSAQVPIQSVIGKKVVTVSRLGKRVLLKFEEDYVVVVHLMIAGRFSWKEAPFEYSRPSKLELCRWIFPSGMLVLTEASSKKRAGIWVLQGERALAEFARSGLDVFTTSFEAFKERLVQTNQTLKRSLTDPNSFDGIGNAFSDEILFRAKLSPLKLSRTLSDPEMATLLEACREVLSSWCEKLLRDIPAFPKSSQVTAFRKEFAVHGKFGQPCLECGCPIQRIAGSENEMNYCAKCQNAGKILADRSLSKLLKDNWPKTIDELGWDS
jgi:formamidopyrimidine-DNA glycosylase